MYEWFIDLIFNLSFGSFRNLEGEEPEVIGICRCIYSTKILNTIEHDVKHTYVTCVTEIQIHLGTVKGRYIYP